MALMAQINVNTVMVGDLNTAQLDRSSRQKINKETSNLLNTLDQIDIVTWLISTEYFTQKLGNTHSFLQLMEPCQK
jgi:hypothetical protein